MEQKVFNTIEEVNKEAISNLLNKLKSLGETFNQMGGYLYSSIIADEMSKINNELYTKYGVDVKFWQPCDGRVCWINLNELIEKYA